MTKFLSKLDSNVAAKLVEVSGFNPGKETVLPADQIILGRDPGDLGLLIPNKEASRRHARIFYDEGSFYVEDLNSFNGTFIDGVKTNKSALKDGALLTVGRTTYRFIIEDSAPIKETTIPTSRPRLPSSEMKFSKHPLEQLKEMNTERNEGLSHLSNFLNQQNSVKDKNINNPVPCWRMTLDARQSQILMLDDISISSEKYLKERIKLNHILEISRCLATILNLSELSNEILSKLFEIFPAVEHASIHVINESGVVPFTSRARSGNDIMAPNISQTIVSLAINEKQSILSTDATEDARFANKESIILQKVRSFMCSPLIFQDKSLGVIYVDTTDAKPRFSVDDLHLFTAVASQFAVAVKNSQLIEQSIKDAFVRSNLARYLPPDLVEKVIEQKIELSTGGSNVFGTVLFSDIVGFTPMSEKMDPQELIKKLNRYFEWMVELVFKFSGTVNRFGGDSILALWGVPVASECDALNAVASALSMQIAVYGFNLVYYDEETGPIKVGIGINTGNFVVGNVGSEQHMEYTLLGKHVNFAQRVESKTAATQVFISQNTYNIVSRRTSTFILPASDLKGVKVSIPMYAVRAVLYGDYIICAISVQIFRDFDVVTGLLIKVANTVNWTIWSSYSLNTNDIVSIVLNPPESPNIATYDAVIEKKQKLDFDKNGITILSDILDNNENLAYQYDLKVNINILPKILTMGSSTLAEKGYLVRE